MTKPAVAGLFSIIGFIIGITMGSGVVKQSDEYRHAGFIRGCKQELSLQYDDPEWRCELMWKHGWSK